jgi:hypothetical protein
MNNWQWRGMPGHLVVADSCCVHMVTDIGRLHVSTIGCYHEHGAEKAYETRKPLGAGGAASLYETMVFALGPDGDVDSWSELDGERYGSEEDAEAGHMHFCRLAAKADGDPSKLAGGD